jgi:hypothetical protein
MSPASLVTGQIAALDQSLAQANGLLDGDEQTQHSLSNLLQRVKGRFRNDLLKLRRDCKSLSQKAQGGNLTAVDLGRLTQVGKDAADVLRECLAFLEGAYTRTAGIDGGMCHLADTMLYSLSGANDLGWERFTLVAAGEFFSKRSGIVRLRFTDTGIWNLPVAVHEFGHYVSGLAAFSDFQTAAADAKRADSRYESHIGELFADLFAIYTTGPCYLLNCSLLRFDFSTASQESATHPSAAQRIWWMTEVLAKMDGDPAWPMYRDVLARAKDLWAASMAVGSQPQLSDQEISRLRRWLVDLYDLVSTVVPNAIYGKWLRAQELSQGFQDGQKPALRDDDSMPEILNAAWLYRLHTPKADSFELDRIERSAYDLCKVIAGKEQ